jgi:hypothetical protein
VFKNKKLLFLLIFIFSLSAAFSFSSPSELQASVNYFTFTETGSTTWTVPLGVTSVDVLIVAGGGAGGSHLTKVGTETAGGGGGAGGVLLKENYTVIPGARLSVVVGAGGSAPDSGPGGNGGDSAFDGMIAIGGGGGGNRDAVPGNGGSGGGVGYFSDVGGSGTSGQGNSGGSSAASIWGGAGGGGAGSAGAYANSNNGANGGAGVYYGDIFSTSYGHNGWFASGGGGGGADGATAGVASSGGGGDGGVNTAGSSAMANTGGGGGGSGDSGFKGGDGGSGIVIIKATVASVDNVGTISTGFKVLKNTTDTGTMVDAHQVCKMVKNYSTTKDYFIPTRTLEEWTAFVNNAPVIADLSLSECASCAQYYGDGSDGALTVSSTSEIINNYTSLSGLESVGDSAITVGSTAGFSAGDEIMILQNRTSLNSGVVVGTYEFVKIASISSPNINLSTPLQNSYDSGAQVISVPNYTDVTVPSGMAITSTPWNGSYGGVVVFKANGIVTVNGGRIETTGDGFRGGKSQTTNYGDGYAGESTSGYPASADASQAGMSLGGGPGGKDSASTSQWGGGGLGGGYGASGASYPAQPSSTYCGSTGAYSGGGTYGINDLSKFFLGSGGGSGGRQDDGSGSGVGGNGGGGVMVLANQIDISNFGSIAANGANGGSAPSTAMGCGGGGSGGSVYLFTSSINTNDSVLALGGTSPSPCGSSRCNGSNGGDGRVAIYSDNSTGTANPTPYTNAGCSAAACGAGYYLDGGVCTITPAGYYSPSNNNAIYACGSAGLWSGIGQAACNAATPGYYTTGGTTTTRTGETGCEANYWCSGGVKTACTTGLISPPLSSLESDCTCVVGGACTLEGGGGCPTGTIANYYSTVDNGDDTCTITYQPDGANGVDAAIFSRDSTTQSTPYPDYTNLYVMAWTWSGVPGVYRNLIKFDYGFLTDATDVVDARLSLYNNGVLPQHGGGLVDRYTNSPWYISRITSDWTEAGVTWLNQPSFTSSNRLSVPAPTSFTTSYPDLNLTQLVKDTVLYGNYGFMITLQTEYHYREVALGFSDHSTASVRPKFVITYNKPSSVGVYTSTCSCSEVSTICGAGYYLDTGVCAIAPAGYYSPADNNTLYECGSNTMWSTAGSASCNAVATGYYTTGGTQTTRTGQSQCACGTYCTSGSQYNCAAGYYGATVGLSVSSCTGTCGSNDYYSSAGSCACSQVAPGEYTTGGTSTTRTGKATCEEGYYCPGPGNGDKYLCPNGTTSPAGSNDISDCAGTLACDGGYYSLSGTCTCVGDGYYSPVNDDNRYICPAGSYCSGCAAAPTCCPDGTYSTATGNTSVASCTNCAAGTAGIGDCQASNTCATCSAGYYSAAGSASCSICAAGTYSSAGSSSCGTCPAGTYSAAGSAVCTACPAGYYSDSASSSCTICPVGTYSGGASASCTDCPAGYTTASTGSDDVADCSIPTSGCAAGYYFLTDACTCVGNGYYSPDADNNRYTCPAGSYCSGCSGAPTSCSAGTYSSSGASSCTNCLCSTYNSTSGSTSCITGLNGYNCSPGSTSSTANACASGYNSTTSDCSYTCSAGYYDSNRDGICEQVTGAYYSPANDYRRYACPAGYTAPSGSDSSADCTIPTTGCGAGYYLYNSVCTCVGNGYYSPDDDNNRYTCPAGSYCSGCSSSGTLCAAGTYSAAGASSCITCPAGSYNTTTGNSSCTTCPAGRYCTGGTNVTCCPDGRYRTTTGGTSVSSCTLCAAGTYGVGTCQTSNTCATCPAGYYCPSGASTYSACSAGSYSTSGSSSCTSCPPGKYSSTSASSSCSNCAGGYYGSSYGNTSSTCDGCCEGGHYCPAGSTSSMQNRCPSGTDSDPYSDSSADCIACPAGTFYMDSINYPVGTSVLYIECENGYNNCITCPEGSYCTGGTRYSCPAGKYNPNSGSTSSAACSTCPANSYCTGSSTYYTSTYYE